MPVFVPGDFKFLSFKKRRLYSDCFQVLPVKGGDCAIVANAPNDAFVILYYGFKLAQRLFHFKRNIAALNRADGD
jgi:hypothetical protein